MDWTFDEESRAGAEHLERKYVAAYDRKSQTDWSEDIRALRIYGVGSSSTVVDLGAGTGSFALAIEPVVARVVGVDVSPAMVEAMRSRGIEAVHAGFLTYEHVGATPDAVFTRNALHHLPDTWKAVALGRIARLLVPGGLLRIRDLAYGFEPHEMSARVESWLAGAPEGSDEGWTAHELAEHVREEHSTFSWLLEAMIERAGFEILDRSISDSGMYAAYTCRTSVSPSDPEA